MRKELLNCAKEITLVVATAAVTLYASKKANEDIKKRIQDLEKEQDSLKRENKTLSKDKQELLDTLRRINKEILNFDSYSTLSYTLCQ